MWLLNFRHLCSWCTFLAEGQFTGFDWLWVLFVNQLLTNSGKYKKVYNMWTQRSLWLGRLVCPPHKLALRYILQILVVGSNWRIFGLNQSEYNSYPNCDDYQSGALQWSFYVPTTTEWFRILTEGRIMSWEVVFTDLPALCRQHLLMLYNLMHYIASCNLELCFEPW